MKISHKVLTRLLDIYSFVVLVLALVYGSTKGLIPKHLLFFLCGIQLTLMGSVGYVTKTIYYIRRGIKYKESMLGIITNVLIAILGILMAGTGLLRMIFGK